MNQLIIFQNYKSLSARKNITVIFSLIIIIFFMQTSLFSQAETDSSDITIHQETNFKTTPQKLYEILLSSREFSACTKKSFPAFSDTSAKIDSAVGGTFSLFDGHIVGRILELVPGERIVEAWRVADWPAGDYSIAKFELKPQGAGTVLTFDHIGFPKGLKEHLSIGWQQHYWVALTAYLQ